MVANAQECGIEYDDWENGTWTARGHWFSPKRPWNEILARASPLADHVTTKAFWDREVRDKCNLYLARARGAVAFTADDIPMGGGPTWTNFGTQQRQARNGWGRGPSRAPAHTQVFAPGSWGVARPGRVELPKEGATPGGPGGKGKPNSGKNMSEQVCWGFQSGTCIGRSCAAGRKHECSVCGRNNHGANACWEGGKGKGDPHMGKGAGAPAITTGAGTLGGGDTGGGDASGGKNRKRKRR